jgi:hypothetical protein
MRQTEFDTKQLLQQSDALASWPQPSATNWDIWWMVLVELSAKDVRNDDEFRRDRNKWLQSELSATNCCTDTLMVNTHPHIWAMHYMKLVG